MNKYNLILLVLIGLVFVSCIQNKEIKRTNYNNDLTLGTLYNNVINNECLNDNNDTIVLDSFLAGYNSFANFGLYKLKVSDSSHLKELYLYIKYIYLDTNSQKNLLMSNKERDSRKICFYLYNDILSYSDDYVRNKRINFNVVKQLVEDYYLNDTIHLMFDVYNRNKGIEIKFHNSAGKSELEKLLGKIEISYINVIDRFCDKQFGKKVYEITNEQLLTLKDSLHFSTNITISYSQTGSFDVYN